MWSMVEWFASWWFALFGGGKKAKILLLGLENAGKTTLFGMLKHGRVTANPPTQQPTAEEFEIGGVTVVAWDMGGHKIARKLWHDYSVQADAVVFLVDATATHKFAEARAELDGLFQEESLVGVPFLILGNKIDMTGAVSEGQLCDVLGVAYDRTGRTSKRQQQGDATWRPLEVFMCSVVRQMGYREGFVWLAQQLKGR